MAFSAVREIFGNSGHAELAQRPSPPPHPPTHTRHHGVRVRRRVVLRPALVPSNRALRACAAAPGSQGGRAVRGGASADRPWTRPCTRPAPCWRLPRTGWRGRSLNEPEPLGAGCGAGLSGGRGRSGGIQELEGLFTDESTSTAWAVMCLLCFPCKCYDTILLLFSAFRPKVFTWLTVPG